MNEKRIENEEEEIGEDEPRVWRICSACGGDGYVLYVGVSGHWDPDMEDYLSSEIVELCPNCNGTGIEEGP